LELNDQFRLPQLQARAFQITTKAFDFSRQRVRRRFAPTFVVSESGVSSSVIVTAPVI
jgi:hypothetical protein